MTDAPTMTIEDLEDVIVGTRTLTPSGISTLACQLLATMQREEALRNENRQLKLQMMTERGMAKVEEAVLDVIRSDYSNASESIPPSPER